MEYGCRLSPLGAGSEAAVAEAAGQATREATWPGALVVRVSVEEGEGWAASRAVSWQQVTGPWWPSARHP